MRLQSSGSLRLVMTIAALAVAACTSTSLVNQWKNPEYAAHAFKRIIVLGVTKQATTRRTFEDEFVAQLKAAGIDAVQSYTVLPEDGPVEEAKLAKAVESVGADGLISARLVKSEQKTEVTPGYYPPVPTARYYGWYSSAWMGAYDPPMVYQYDVYTSETSLYDLSGAKVVWSGMAQTLAPSDLRKEIAAYAKLMIKAMKDAKVL